MKRWVKRAGELALVFAIVACSASSTAVQARAANVIAKASNEALDLAVAKYQAEGMQVVTDAATLDDARAAVATVRARWKPIWTAWEVYRLAADAWADALERNDAAAATAAVDAMRAGYCGFRRTLPPSIAAGAKAIGCAS